MEDFQFNAGKLEIAGQTCTSKQGIAISVKTHIKGVLARFA